jgi:hypothetical protein
MQKMDFEIILLYAPILALAIAVLFSSKGDSVTSHAMAKASENPAIKFKVIISSIIAPVIVLSMNSSLGVVFLTVAGLMMIFQEKLFTGHSLLSNSTAKVFGYIYLVVGALWSIST